MKYVLVFIALMALYGAVAALPIQCLYVCNFISCPIIDCVNGTLTRPQPCGCCDICVPVSLFHLTLLLVF